MIAPHDLSIRQLQYIVAVADTLGFHRAAEREHVSQPTLSVQVRELEDLLGVRIFERDRKRVLLTAAGADIVAHARKVLLSVGDLVAAASASRDPFARPVHLGIIPTVAPYLLPRLIPEARERHPQLALRLTEAKTNDLVVDLHEGRLDAAIVAMGVDGLEPFASAKILDDPFVVAMAPSHPLAARRQLTLGDLASETVLLLDDGHCLRTHALALCASVPVREDDVRATSLSTLVQMVAAGRGITLLPTLAVPVENRRAQLVVRPLRPQPAPSRTLALVWRPGNPIAPALRALAELFAKSARKPELPEPGARRGRRPATGRLASRA